MTQEEWQKYPADKRRAWARETPLAWILEYQPTILLPGKGFIPFELWDFQKEFISNQDRFRAVNKPRQCGISTTAAAEVAWKVTHKPGAQIIIVSKDLDAAVNFHRYVYNILNSVKGRDPDMPKMTKDNTRETEFGAFGSRVVSLTASKETGRSFSATDWYFDEMAHAEYADDIFQAAAPTISQTNGTITAISTPKGRGNLYARIFEEPEDFGFTVFNFKWWDVPTYNPFYAEYKAAETEKEREYWIAEARKGEWYKQMRPKYTELSWLQEFEGSFDVDAEKVFSTRQIEKTFWRNWLNEDNDSLGICSEYYTSEPVEGHYYSTGVDVGRKNDATVIITYDTSVNPATMVEYKYIPAGHADYVLIEKSVRETHKKFNMATVVVDATGTGDPLAEILQDIAEPFTFTLSKKVALIDTTRLAMDNGAIKMPKIKRMYQEHQKYEWQDKYLTQDTVMANALAVSDFYDPDSLQNVFLDVNYVGSAL